jgi:hypothetical protein
MEVRLMHRSIVSVAGALAAALLSLVAVASPAAATAAIVPPVGGIEAVPGTTTWDPGTWFPQGFTATNGRGCMQMRIGYYTTQRMHDSTPVDLYTLQVWNLWTHAKVWESDKGFSEYLAIASDGNLQGWTRVFTDSIFGFAKTYRYDPYQQRVVWQSAAYYPAQGSWHAVLVLGNDGDLAVRTARETSPGVWDFTGGSRIWHTGTSCGPPPA